MQSRVKSVQFYPAFFSKKHCISILKTATLRTFYIPFERWNAAFVRHIYLYIVLTIDYFAFSC